VGEDQNIFTLGRTWDSEDQLTEMLAWLVSVVPAVGDKLISLAVPGEDPQGMPVPVTQKVIPTGRLDLVLETDDTRVVIESKLESSYHDDQLGRYIRWLAKQPGHKRSALLTLTKHPGEWTHDETALAEQLGISHAAHRWEEVHALLDGVPVGEGAAVPGRLVREFRELLEEEGLIPVKPLTGDELLHAWPEAYVVITHYHKFFSSATRLISEAIGGEATAGKNSRVWWTYQTYERASGDHPTVGISAKSENGVPFLWISIDAPSWDTAATALAALSTHAPVGWSAQAKGWYDQPLIWRDLRDVISPGTLEDQQAELAKATRDALAAWLAVLG
jgi:hypothetical protein